MNNLKLAIDKFNKQIIEAPTTQSLPFSIYSSIKEQHILNVPVVKPLFIAILGGEKQLGKQSEISCTEGQFIFLSNSAEINMRNIPKEKPYSALLIEFEQQDFDDLPTTLVNKGNFCLGEVTTVLDKFLTQFVEWSHWAPSSLWALRRKELLQLLFHIGYPQILSMAINHNIAHKLHALFTTQHNEDPSLSVICQKLAMSESTLRRKLKLAGTSVQAIKDQVKLGLGLHLLQSTHHPIGLIAEKCGYSSQSRFTERFKGRFGLTPSELRKTRMAE